MTGRASLPFRLCGRSPHNSRLVIGPDALAKALNKKGCRGRPSLLRSSSRRLVRAPPFNDSVRYRPIRLTAWFFLRIPGLHNPKCWISLTIERNASFVRIDVYDVVLVECRTIFTTIIFSRNCLVAGWDNLGICHCLAPTAAQRRLQSKGALQHRSVARTPFHLLTPDPQNRVASPMQSTNWVRYGDQINNRIHTLNEPADRVPCVEDGLRRHGVCFPATDRCERARFEQRTLPRPRRREIRPQ